MSDIKSSKNDVLSRIRTRPDHPKEHQAEKLAIVEFMRTPPSSLGLLALLSTASSILFYRETRLQNKLTRPPLVYSQNTPMLQQLRHLLSHGPDTRHAGPKQSFLERKIKPSLLVGTRGTVASMAAYLVHGSSQTKHFSFREIMTMTDGATIAVDWMVPYPKYASSLDTRLSDKQLEANILYGPIDVPVVIILHGINNDTGFGYMQSLMNSVADRGWVACGMNFRGCGGQKLSTPRGYNAAYTGDLRTLLQKLESRLSNGDDTSPVFLVGNSLGANLITKYLGEEGFCGTLPRFIRGGVSLGNPLHIHSGSVKFPFNVLLGAGVKRTVLQSWKTFRDMSNCVHFGSAIRQVMLSKTIGELDDAFAPFLIRNDPTYPFKTKVGYRNGEEYWRDASSNRYIQHVTVPLLILSAQDDVLVVNPARQSLSRCLENPNVLVVKTKCGGHLGWQEAPEVGYGIGIGRSWANNAVCDFIDASLRMTQCSNDEHDATSSKHMDVLEGMYASRRLQSKL